MKEQEEHKMANRRENTGSTPPQNITSTKENEKFETDRDKLKLEIEILDLKFELNEKEDMIDQ